MPKRNLYSKVDDFFRIVLNDPQRKSLPAIFSQYLKYLITDRALAQQYFAKFLYRKGIENHHEYMVTHKIQGLCWDLNDKDFVSILDNKFLFELFCGLHNISSVKSYAYNINSLFFTGEKIEQITTLDAFEAYLKRLLALNKKSPYLFIKRTAGSGGGKNIYRISADDLSEGNKFSTELFGHVLASGYVFQEAVVQHADIDKINPYCLNTMRWETFTNKESGTRVMGGVFRIGLNNSYVDNTSSGGAYLGIDMENKCLKREAFSDFTNGRAKTYYEHPFTKVKFEGIKVPYFDEIVELITKAGSALPQIKIVGWDVAVTPEGPILIEGNELPSLMFEDIAQNGLRRNPVFMDMYKEVADKI